MSASARVDLDIEDHGQLVAYLRQSGRVAADEQPVMRTLSGGVSNRTVLVQRREGEAWVLKQALPKLRVQADWHCSPERIHREALALQWLPRLTPAGSTTPLVFEDSDAFLLAMQAVPEPHENWKEMLLGGHVHTSHVERFGSLLRSIHHNARAHLPELGTFSDRSFFEALRLEPYYEYTAQQVPEAALFLAELCSDTRRRQETLVHGDYSPKNVLVRDEQLVLLDHEVVHLGDPAFDLGFSLAHLLSKAHHLPQHRDAFLSASLTCWHAYDGDSTFEARVVRHALACLLARVAGRSPLEYLDDGERANQQRAVLSLLHSTPLTLQALIGAFAEEIGR
jgi:aminoglycoside phosphotransferase (APT) family kinase protein